MTPMSTDEFIGACRGVLLFIGLLLLLQGCGSGLTAADSALVAVEVAQQKDCVDSYSPDAAAQNICRAQVKAWWSNYWASLDGGAQ